MNDRRLMDAVLRQPGHSSSQPVPAFSALLDRRPKMTEDAWRKATAELGLSGAQLANLDALLRDEDLWKSSDELRRFFAASSRRSVLESTCASTHRSSADCSTTRAPSSRPGRWAARSGAHCSGGGRYDNLLSDVGGSPLPAVGFALGDVVMTLLLEKYGLLPSDLRVYPAPILVTVFDADHQTGLTSGWQPSFAEPACASLFTRMPRNWPASSSMQTGSRPCVASSWVRMRFALEPGHHEGPDNRCADHRGAELDRRCLQTGA